MEKQVGKTRDSGWQFGLQRTFPYPLEMIWDFMLSPEGLGIWLGKLDADLTIGIPFKTREGIEGKVRVFHNYSHIRINWKKPHWDNMSTVQVRVIDKGKKSAISFHQEKMINSGQREEMKKYWREKMEAIQKALDKNSKQ